MVCEPLAGKREIFVTGNHCAKQWAEVVTYIAEEMYPQAEMISLVQDNLSAHKVSALYEIHPPQKARSIIERLEIVFTPKHGSCGVARALVRAICTNYSRLCRHKQRLKSHKKLFFVPKKWNMKPNLAFLNLPFIATSPQVLFGLSRT